MHHLLTTMLYLHTKNIAHGDLIIDNIFVHWPVGTTDWPAEPTSPPDFLIGDFGCSYTLPPDHAAKRQHRVTDTHQAIHKDLASISECVDIAMAGPWHDVDETAQAIRAKARYSGALLRASETLAQLPGLLQRFKVSRAEDGEMFDRVVKPLKLEIECGLKEAERVEPKPDYTHVRPRGRELNRGAFSYETSEDLLACSFRPPGPWCIAEVDLDGRLKAVDLARRFCEEEAMVTLGGREMEGGQVWEEWPEACG